MNSINIKIDLICRAEDLMTFDKAKEFCKRKGGRLPTLVELRILQYISNQYPKVLPQSGWFWSSSESSTYGAWSVSFAGGGEYNGYKYLQGGVLCVGNNPLEIDINE